MTSASTGTRCTSIWGSTEGIRRPLVGIALSLALGIVVADALRPPLFGALAAAGVWAALGLALLAMRGSARWIFVVSLLITFDPLPVN